MSWIATVFYAFTDDKKRAVLLIAAAMTALYALITIFSMVKLTALTMVLFTGAQALMLLSLLCYIVVILTTRESVSRHHFEPGEVIFHQGEVGHEVYVIISGEVEVVREEAGGGETIIARLGPADFFGEMALIRTAPRLATVRAVTALEVLVMQRGAFLSLFTHLPVLRNAFQQVLEKRIQELRTLAKGSVKDFR